MLCYVDLQIEDIIRSKIAKSTSLTRAQILDPCKIQITLLWTYLSGLSHVYLNTSACLDVRVTFVKWLGTHEVEIIRSQLISSSRMTKLEL